ncbi:cytochrome c-type biogenesis protein CcmF [Chitinophaga skermanii]|uniref:Cytochrome c-type biogenesis protein CcmF n=1 Tax=Chitinophaga skermanii TaxID=331697 RepID=A0A327QQS0_9BACT|nr:cytochrome c biogenesis protein CcsA [Chitinophaga skermanii]RAJ06909.1 cytochrome c-type biogenesis protein CcmF [Chitinophaga skermanii]
METKFLNEHLLPGQIGHFAAVLAFVASIVATIAYVCAVQLKDDLLRNSWKKIARVAFLVQVVAVFTVFFTLYHMISGHLFEYKYVWQHSSKSLEVKYLLSCFWEGQEGSFLLWSIWHCVLGTIVMFTSKSWEAPVMASLSLAQVFVASMILGIYILDYRVGSSPFVLMRNENADAPIFQMANYMTRLQDGNGLNPLLQNYWMVIHPPVLFLGFASTIIPFSFAFAGLWTKRYTEWVKPVLPWALFAAGILGLGIMMGAAWAYESLTFGGYWAWDPVENASLVPWLTLVAGIHTLLAYRSTGYSLKITYFFFFITFTLILYSSFLTKSGVLGQTSVHSFTDLGMNGQLLIYMFVFAIPAFWFLIAKRKAIPAPVREESTYSREFWLFVGSLVLLVSAIQICFTTSIPVWSKLPGLKDLAPPTEPELFYNKIQIWVAVVIGLLTAVTQYLKYKNTSKEFFVKKIWLPTVISLVITVAIIVGGKVYSSAYGPGFLFAIYLMMFASVYAVVANFAYIWIGSKGKLKASGASVAHVGFGLVLVGILISSSKKEVLSLDKMGILDGYFTKESKQNSRENLMLPKGMPVQMGDYYVTYEGDSTAPKDAKTYFIIRYEKKKSLNDVPTEKFTLYPDAFMNVKGQEGITPNPDSKHYWHKDVFTYITAVPKKDAPETDTIPFTPHKMSVGDTTYFSKGFIILDNLSPKPTNKNYVANKGEVALEAELRVLTKDDKQFTLRPVFALTDSTYAFNIPDTAQGMGLIVKLGKIVPEEKKVVIETKESGTITDYVVLKAYVFPAINVLWIGIIVMTIGFFMSAAQRRKSK